jgi:S-adenosylmethionine:tRNA ribosyltransferase-isomerase
VRVHFVTLHVGLGTFAPVKALRVEDHVMHAEQFELPTDTAEAINAAKREGRRVIAVGTTTVRVLESAAACGRRGDEPGRSQSESASSPHPSPRLAAGERVSEGRERGCQTRSLRREGEVCTDASRKIPPLHVGVYGDDELRALAPARGRTDIFIHAPFRFRVVDGLLTNFHLPQSTLLMLVSAFAAPGEVRGRDLVLSACAEAVRERYRFYSYGDAMLVL